MNKAFIKSVEVYLPENVVHNHEIEERINRGSTHIESGMLGRLFGSKTRRFAPAGVQVSDLACEAARKVIRQNSDVSIDLLIFAAASSDLIEPATANIVQTKLGLACPAMDIKNACNSFVSAIQVSVAFIESGAYRNILIVCGEKLSEVVNYAPRDSDHLLKCLCGYSLGDAGAAMLMSTATERGVVYQKSRTWGQYWELCTVAGGGSLAYRDFERYSFECNSTELRKAFLACGAPFVTDCLAEAGWAPHDIDCVVSHQISVGTTSFIADSIGLQKEKFINTFVKYGNTAAATIPVALHEAVTSGKLAKGSKLLILGLAAGISVSVQLVEW